MSERIRGSYDDALYKSTYTKLQYYCYCYCYYYYYYLVLTTTTTDPLMREGDF